MIAMRFHGNALARETVLAYLQGRPCIAGESVAKLYKSSLVMGEAHVALLRSCLQAELKVFFLPLLYFCIVLSRGCVAIIKRSCKLKKKTHQSNFVECGLLKSRRRPSISKMYVHYLYYT